MMTFSRRALLSLPALIPASRLGAAATDRYVVLISLDGFPAYALDDPRLPVPTLRRLMREGAFARRMKTSNPAVTWSAHTTIVTGVLPRGHGMIFNGRLERQGPKSPPKVEPHRPKVELVQAPTVYDLVHGAGMTTAQVDWVAIENASTVTWQFAEWPDTDGEIEKEMIAAGTLTASDIEEFERAPITWRDRIWTQAAAHIIARHRPNLLLFHLLNLDSVHHHYGPRNLASNTAIAFADDRVRELLEAIETAGIRDRTTVLVVSDHGFKSHTREIRPNALLREQGLVAAEGGKIECNAWAVSEGGTAMVYITDPANRDRLAPQLQQLFGSLEGVDRVLEPADYAPLGYPDPARNDQMSDLVLAAKTGYAFAETPNGPPVLDMPAGGSPGQHGYLNSDPDMDAIFIAWGRGIGKGMQLEGVRNLDLAPTVAHLLGLQMSDTTGRVLAKILV